MVALVLGTIFFGLIAAIHSVSATGAGSIHWLVVLWIVVPAPAVFLWQMLAHGMKKRWRILSQSYLALATLFAPLVLGGVAWIGAERAIHPKPPDYGITLADYPELQAAAEVVSFQVPEGNRRVG